MKSYFCAFIFVSAVTVNHALAAEEATEEIEEVVVTASFVDQTLSEIKNPLHVVSGGDVSNRGTQSLGESLNNLLGVASADYGSGVGQPVVRGMSGSRVKILNNGLVVRDVSGLGADHINDLDLNNIQQIEIVKGPSSLLHSNGTIGGIINVVDNTIARKDFSESEFRLGLERQSVNDGDAQSLSYQNNLKGINLSVAYKDSKFGNFDVPNGAILSDEDGEDGEDGEEHHEEDLGFLSDSDHESTSQRIGLSKTGGWGYFGLSFNRVESLYGIPFHGEEEEVEGEEHEEERIFSTTDSDVFNLEGSYALNSRWLQKIDYYFRDTDYALTEQHDEGEDEEEEGEEEHEEEGPTLFKNDAREYGAIFDLSRDSFSQKVVLNFIEEDISIIGDEAYMNPSSNEETTVGYYMSRGLGLFHLDLGFRYDQISRDGSVSTEDEDAEDEGEEEHAVETEYFSKSTNNASFAASLGRYITDSLGINLSFASLERAPSAVELFINGPHLATGRFEVGGVNLNSERSNNIDLTINYEKNGFYGALTFFRNDVDNYIYLLDGVEEERDDDEEEDGHGHGGELISANYVQQDAELEGYEFEFGKTFELGRGSLSLSFGRDSVSGEFKGGNHIPRMVPARNIYAISYVQKGFEVELGLKDVEEQNNTALNETSTNGYQLLDLKLVKSFTLASDIELSISLFANNLLDEVARNHASFVKDQVPLPGENYGAKLNLVF